jgi:hypothetical protein
MPYQNKLFFPKFRKQPIFEKLIYIYLSFRIIFIYIIFYYCIIQSVMECSICYENIERSYGDYFTSEYALILPCAHRFHKECINTWFDKCHILTCPYCRTEVIENENLKFHIDSVIIKYFMLNIKAKL